MSKRRSEASQSEEAFRASGGIKKRCITQSEQEPMRFGCSECLCIAIESHRPALLKLLLRRSDVVYRDIFWAPMPRRWNQNFSISTKNIIPILHDIRPNTDLSFVGRDNCGHMRVDVDLLTPFDTLSKPNAYILVSLPFMARWHTSKRFNAERILRQSGQFDYSAPQFYHRILVYDCDNRLKGPLNLFRDVDLCCEFEGSSAPLGVTPNPVVNAILLQQRSSVPHGIGTASPVSVLSEHNEHYADITKAYGSVARLFLEISGGTVPSAFRKYGVQSDLRRFLRAGQDINHFAFGQQFQWAAGEQSCQMHQYDIVSAIGELCDGLDGDRETASSPRIIEHFVRFLLRNGLSYFYGEIHNCVVNDHISFMPAPLQSLLSTNHKWADSFLLVARGIARQLLALGYGRRELHPGSLPVRDEKLRMTRAAARTARQQQHARQADELQALVDEFDAGPLTLQQLARISIQRAVGGVCFERRVRALGAKSDDRKENADSSDRLLPPMLFKYVALADDMLIQY